MLFTTEPSLQLLIQNKGKMLYVILCDEGLPYAHAYIQTHTENVSILESIKIMKRKIEEKVNTEEKEVGDTSLSVQWGTKGKNKHGHIMT